MQCFISSNLSRVNCGCIDLLLSLVVRATPPVWQLVEVTTLVLSAQLNWLERGRDEAVKSSHSSNATNAFECRCRHTELIIIAGK